MKLIILDRDGVINFDSEDYIKSPEEWRPIPGSIEAIAALTKMGYIIAVATNQSGVGRGLYTEKQLERIHKKMLNAVAEQGGKIDYIAYCPHVPDDNCACRKPKPGLLYQIAKHYNIDLTNIPFVGDSLRDLEAAVAVGCQPILLLTGNGLAVASEAEKFPDVQIFKDLKEYVEYTVTSDLGLS